MRPEVCLYVPLTFRDMSGHASSRSARLCLIDMSIRQQKQRLVVALQRLSGTFGHARRQNRF